MVDVKAPGDGPGTFAGYRSAAFRLASATPATCESSSHTSASARQVGYRGNEPHRRRTAKVLLTLAEWLLEIGRDTLAEALRLEVADIGADTFEAEAAQPGAQ